MGLFDTVEIDVNRLPVSDDDKRLLRGAEFQTKSLENVLTVAVVTDDGRLMYQGTEYSECGKPFHGYLYFYGAVGYGDTRQWFGFNAKFTDGKLVDIERVER